MSLIVPKLSLNGTSAADLIAARIDVREALLKVMEGMHRLEPHGRDYPNGVLHRAAHAIHRTRVAWLATLHTELGNEAEAIDAQIRR